MFVVDFQQSKQSMLFHICVCARVCLRACDFRCSLFYHVCKLHPEAVVQTSGEPQQKGRLLS